MTIMNKLTVEQVLTEIDDRKSWPSDPNLAYHHFIARSLGSQNVARILACLGFSQDHPVQQTFEQTKGEETKSQYQLDKAAITAIVYFAISNDANHVLQLLADKLKHLDLESDQQQWLRVTASHALHLYISQISELAADRLPDTDDIVSVVKQLFYLKADANYIVQKSDSSISPLELALEIDSGDLRQQLCELLLDHGAESTATLNFLKELNKRSRTEQRSAKIAFLQDYQSESSMETGESKQSDRLCEQCINVSDDVATMLVQLNQHINFDVLEALAELEGLTAQHILSLAESECRPDVVAELAPLLELLTPYTPQIYAAKSCIDVKLEQMNKLGMSLESMVGYIVYQQDHKALSALYRLYKDSVTDQQRMTQAYRDAVIAVELDKHACMLSRMPLVALSTELPCNNLQSFTQAIMDMGPEHLTNLQKSVLTTLIGKAGLGPSVERFAMKERANDVFRQEHLRRNIISGLDEADQCRLSLCSTVFLNHAATGKLMAKRIENYNRDIKELEKLSSDLHKAQLFYNLNALMGSVLALISFPMLLWEGMSQLPSGINARVKNVPAVLFGLLGAVTLPIFSAAVLPLLVNKIFERCSVLSNSAADYNRLQPKYNFSMVNFPLRFRVFQTFCCDRSREAIKAVDDTLAEKKSLRNACLNKTTAITIEDNSTASTAAIESKGDGEYKAVDMHTPLLSVNRV
ncbi:MAG: hypothetical protein P1U40_07025 [Coxiellaceae bacterium]|nr:hypothetical protein [Coxiellaceae bacterium]